MDLDVNELRKILREVHKIRFNNKSVDIFDTFFNKVKDFENVDYSSKTMLYIQLFGSHYRISKEKNQNKVDSIKVEKYIIKSNTFKDSMYSLRFCNILPELERLSNEDKVKDKEDRSYL